jgi:hypothetical protein
MKRLLSGLAIATLIALCCAGAWSADAPLKIGVGVEGPITPQTERQIELAVGEIPGARVIPIVPPGDTDACVRRFVAGDPDDRLDGLIIVRLPPNSYKGERGASQVSFDGTYEVSTLDFSTMVEDRRHFTFSDAENVTGGMGALLAMPAEILAERTTGRRLVAGSSFQAMQDVQVRVESKFLSALRSYLASAPIRNVHPLDPLECARRLMDAGDTQTATIVLKSAGAEMPPAAIHAAAPQPKPPAGAASQGNAQAGAEAKSVSVATTKTPQSRVSEASAMLASAQIQMKQSHALAILGRTLGAIAVGNAQAAETELASYESQSGSDPARVGTLKRTVAAMRATTSRSEYGAALKANVPALDRSGFLAMIKQVFDVETGMEPAQIELASNSLEISDKAAEKGLRTRLDGYASALGKSAQLMSIRCGCEAAVTLRAERSGSVLMRARFGPSFNRPEVGIP